MAAEHEGTERTAEEICQLLYHLQVLMLAKRHLTRRRLHAPLKATTMLRIAVPNKGSLSEPAAAMLQEAGYRTRRDPKELVVSDADNGVELFYLRPRDIAVYVGSGTVDCGITGRDLLLDSGSAAVEVMALGFGASTFRYAARPGTATALADVDRPPGRHQLPGPGREAPGRPRHRRLRRAPRRCRRDRDHARRRRRHRRRRRDRPDAAQPGPRDVRRADPAQRGRAGPPRGQRGAVRRRGAAPPAAGRHHRAALRDARLRRARRPSSTGPARSPRAWSRRPCRTC